MRGGLSDLPFPARGPPLNLQLTFNLQLKEPVAIFQSL